MRRAFSFPRRTSNRRATALLAGSLTLAWIGSASAAPLRAAGPALSLTLAVLALGRPVLGAVPRARVLRPGEEPEPRDWYGWQTLWLDIAATVGGVAALTAEGPEDLSPWASLFVPIIGPHTIWILAEDSRFHLAVAFPICAAMSGLGPPLVHALHGRNAAAAASLSLRALPPLLVALSFMGEPSPLSPVVMYAALLSYPTAVVLDSAVLGSRPAEGAWQGAFLPVPGGGALTAARTW